MSWLFLRHELVEEFAQLSWRANDIASAMEWLHSQQRARRRASARFSRPRQRPAPTPEQRRRNAARERTRYHTDAEYRVRKIGYYKNWYQRTKADPERWAKLLAQSNKSKATRRPQVNAAERVRLAAIKADPVRLARLRARERAWCAANRERIRECRAAHKEKYNAAARAKYRTNNAHRLRRQAANRARRKARGRMEAAK
jgi:hypothetical protein